jgi:hypothetical protein
MALLHRLRRLLPGLWAGWLLCVSALATPAAFALLDRPAAARVVARMLAQEAYTSLVIGTVLLVLERLVARRAVQAGSGSQFSTGMVLALAALFATVVGYFALQPMMEAARAGHGSLSFGQLHAISLAFYGLKLVLVFVLAWRALKPTEPTEPAQPISPVPSS